MKLFLRIGQIYKTKVVKVYAGFMPPDWVLVAEVSTKVFVGASWAEVSTPSTTVAVAAGLLRAALAAIKYGIASSPSISHNQDIL